MQLNVISRVAPYVVIFSLALTACTNREILHGSSLDKPPSLKVAKRQSANSKSKSSDAAEQTVKDEHSVAEETSQDAEKTEADAKETAQTSEVIDKATDKSSDQKHIWFARESKGAVQPYSVERTLDKKEPLRSAVSQLLEGPTDGERKLGIKSEVPVGTVLISLKKKDDVVELNLSRRFGAGGVDSIETRLQQLELTIKEVAGHDKVFLDIEGKRMTSAGDGLEVKQPLN